MAGVTDSSREKEYQDLLLTLLDQEKNPELVKQKLLEDSRFKHLRDYLESVDLDMIAVAQELTSKWGKKR